MPANKNAFLRYWLLDQCFANKYRKFDINELIDFVSDKSGYRISLRQIREDIANLRLGPYYAPIVATRYDGKKCHYHYDDPGFSIFKNKLSAEELAGLRSAIHMLGRYRGIPANRWLEEVILRMEYCFGIKNDVENLIAFDQNEQLKGLEHLSGLIDATVGHCPIHLVYRPYHREQRTFTVHPYYVRQYNGRWFLFGLNESKKRIESYALDRIEAYRPSESVFIPNESTDFSTYFDDVVGVSVPYGEVKTEEVILRFSPRRFPYVASKPIHPTQQLCAESCTVRIRVKPNKELSQQIFSFIPDVEVLAPEWFRQEIKAKLMESLGKYGYDHPDCMSGK